MAPQSVSANEFSGTASTFPGPDLIPTTGVPVAGPGITSDSYARNLWHSRRDLAADFAGPPGALANQGPGPVGSGSERVTGLKRWEGRILDISDGILEVELTPSDHDGPTLLADFAASLLGPDLSSAAAGDIVYLTTRTVRDTTGYPAQTSSLKLRRLGRWNEHEFREIRDIARKQADFFKELP